MHEQLLNNNNYVKVALNDRNFVVQESMNGNE
jgi:hypothetical protein